MTQIPESSRPFNSNDLAGPLAGSALSLEQVEKRTIKLPSGDSRIQTRQSMIYRDTAGRMRIESVISDASGRRNTIVQIRDPIAGFVAFLNPDDRVALRIVTPKMNPPSQGGFGLFGTPVGMPGENAKHEQLERRTIVGIACDGIRITSASGDLVDEHWFSTELGLVPVIEASSPDEHYSAKILKVTRTDPDPELFVIPKEYTIQEAGDLSKD